MPLITFWDKFTLYIVTFIFWLFQPTICNPINWRRVDWPRKWQWTASL